MFVASLHLPCPDAETCEAVEAALAWHLVHLDGNDQVARYLTWVADGAVHAVAEVPSPDALSPHFLDRGGRETLVQLVTAWGGEPVWEVQAPAGARCEAPLQAGATPALFLRAADLVLDGPVYDGATGLSVPRYLLGLSNDLLLDLWAWPSGIRALHAVWTHSGRLERAAYRELATFDSRQNQRGRDLAAAVEAELGIPTFLWLHRFYAYARTERERVCPACGEAWRADQAAVDIVGADQVCVPCRLVSTDGTFVEGAAWAGIGARRPSGWAGRSVDAS